MEEIYSFAAVTYIWLGRGNNDSDQAVAWFKWISRGILIEEVVQFASTPTSSLRSAAWRKMVWAVATEPCRHFSRWLRSVTWKDIKNREFYAMSYKSPEPSQELPHPP